MDSLWQGIADLRWRSKDVIPGWRDGYGCLGQWNRRDGHRWLWGRDWRGDIDTEGRGRGALRGLRKGVGKGAHVGKALFRLSGERRQHDLLDLWRKRWRLRAQRWWWLLHLCHADGDQVIPVKGLFAGQPFVNDDGQRVLIAGGADLILELLRGGVDGCAAETVNSQMASGLLEGDGNAKIAE